MKPTLPAPPTSSTATRLPYRRTVLLALLQSFNGALPARDFQKFLMLFTKEFGAAGVYDFVPYRFGGFSFQSYADRRALVTSGLLADTDDWSLTGTTDYISQLSDDDRTGLERLHQTYGHLRGRSLVREVYRRYPYHAIRSEIAQGLMTPAQLATIHAARPTPHDECLFTIGYEGISLDAYLNKLIRADVKLLCDVRRNPLSRKYGFSKSTLQSACESLAIAYRHIPALGISSQKRRNLSSPADYTALFREYECTTLVSEAEQVSTLANLVKTHHRVALTCFEADVCMCHRGRIADAIARLPDAPAAIQHL